MAYEYPRDKTACFTGHRQMTGQEAEMASRAIAAQIETLASCGVHHYYAGGAIGFDMIAAQTVVEMRDTRFPELLLTLALPFRGHTARWRSDDRYAFYEVLNRADNVIYISDEYHRFCMQKRNMYMVDRSSVCLAYLKDDRGGTYNTVKYAKQSGVPVRNLAFNGKDVL